MQDIKVIFKGNKSPSGMDTHKEYWIGKKKLANLQADGKFDIEVLQIPEDKPKPKKKKTAKKGKK